MKFTVYFLFLIPLFYSCSTKKKVALIVTNAHIYTVNDSSQVVNTMIIDEGKIIELGDNLLLKKYDATKILDVKGQFIYPGFIDAHCHYTGYAMDAYKLKLFGTQSFDEVIQKLIDFSKSNKRVWIEGTGWDQNDWKNKNFPTKDTLDTLFPNTPVFLLRVDGHAALLNQKALDLSGIDNNTKLVGGEIVKKDGKLTGIIIDNAIEIVRKKLPELEKKDAINYILKAQDEFFELGLTSVVETGITHQVMEWMKKLNEEDKLLLKSTFMLMADDEHFSSYLISKPYKNKRMHIAGFKVFGDGALGSRGAFMLDDYSDRHGHKGSMLLSSDSLLKIAQLVYQSKYQLAVHAIGDAANREVLKIYAKTLLSKNDRRWRIEHAQVVDPNDIHLFRDFSIIPSVQPSHAISDMKWVEDRIEYKRMSGAYAYQNLLQQNNWLPLGTDFPVENLNPIHTFYAAVFRKDKDELPQLGFQLENALTREEALRGMTIWAAKSVFEEDEKGSLEKGKAADFVILSVDLLNANAKDIYNAKIKSTYINGKEVYTRKK
ncbi:MAG TPA: amidohydrolase [Chitinophagaceae bacterium]|nr:amidohydrolase [Chitinophagaceae bacterium]